MWNGRNEHGNVSFYQKLCINAARQWRLNLCQTIKNHASYHLTTTRIALFLKGETIPTLTSLYLVFFKKFFFHVRVKRYEKKN